MVRFELRIWMHRLWPETIQALKKVPRFGQLVFYTSEGHPWVRTLVKTKGDGERKYTFVNRVTTRFSMLLKKVGIHVPKGTGCHCPYHLTAAQACPCTTSNEDSSNTAGFGSYHTFCLSTLPFLPEHIYKPKHTKQVTLRMTFSFLFPRISPDYT